MHGGGVLYKVGGKLPFLDGAEDDNPAFLLGSAQLQVPLRHGTESLPGSELKDPLKEFHKWKDCVFRESRCCFLLYEFFHLLLGDFNGVPEEGKNQIRNLTAVMIQRLLRENAKTLLEPELGDDRKGCRIACHCVMRFYAHIVEIKTLLQR